MTATLAPAEYCRNNHRRTPSNTYVNPGTKKRQCRDCSGEQAQTSATGITPRPSKTFTPDELKRLREIVKCVHCGAVPMEVTDEDGNVIMREVGDGNGGTIMLPTVATPHPTYCPGKTNTGRPRKERKRSLPAVDAGCCEACGGRMVAAPHRVGQKRFCDDVCRSAAGKRRRAEQGS